MPREKPQSSLWRIRILKKEKKKRVATTQTDVGHNPARLTSGDANGI